MREILILLIAFVVPTIGYTEYIDEEVKKVDIERDKAVDLMLKKCKKTNNYVKCKDKEYKVMRKKYPRRGSLEYSKQHYAKLTKEQADIVIKKLASIAKQADVGRLDEDGEISLTNMTNEGNWIQREVYKRRYSTGPFTLSNGQQLDY